MGFLEFPLIRLGLFYLSGILLAPLLYFNADVILQLVLSLFIACILSSLLPLGRKLKQLLFGPFCVLLVFSLGIYGYTAQQDRYAKAAEQFISGNRKEALTHLTIAKLINETGYYLKYEADAVSAGNGSSQRILLRLKKDSLCQYLKIGSEWLYKGRAALIPGPKNPHDFDYANYMKLQGIPLQFTATKAYLQPLDKAGDQLKYLPAIWQQSLVKQLKTTISDPQHYQLLAALLFGYKSDLSPETKSQFATAGVMHLLAVSGLHVGVVMLFARWVFGFLRRLPKGRHLQSIAVLVIVWCFALLTGASVSVLRAATLFSFLIAGQLSGGQGHSINSLFASMWLLLVINPLFGFQVGFQLSYLAVFYILWLMPGWGNYYTFKNSYLKKAWQLLGLSLIAQLATAPLSIFYFHRFPSYFLISNLLLLPFMSILLIWGFVSVLLVALIPSAAFVLIPLEIGVGLMFKLIGWVETLPAASLEIPHYDLRTTLLLVCFAMIFAHLFKKKSRRLLPFTGFAAVCVILAFRSYNYQYTTEELILSHQFSRTQLIHQRGRTVIVYESAAQTDDYSLELFTAARNTKNVQKTNLPVLLEYNDKRILIVDGSYNADARLSEIDGLLLTDNAKIHLERWIRLLRPKFILADGSSYPSVKKRWAQTAVKRRLPFHDTAQTGAFKFE